MPLMVPTGLGDGPRLAELLPSCVAAMRGKDGTVSLPRMRSAVVAVVDGLGIANLRERAGHARFLAGAIGKRSIARSGGPTTTAAALTSLTTGTDAGTHGVVGYAILDPSSDRVVNQLSGWGAGAVQPTSWQRSETVFEREAGIRSVVVGQRRYRDSGFTAAALRGAEYLGVDDMEERFVRAAELTRGSEPVLVYLYVPELDMAAHAEGTASDRWITGLERLDAAVSVGERMLARDAGLLVTADHGMLDIPASSHILIDEDPALVDGVRHVAGDPRLLHLYLEPDAAPAVRERLVAAWRTSEQRRAWVMTRDEAVDAGIFGAVDQEVLPRIGDVLVAARARVAYYDSRIASAGARSMVGQHGSFTAEEREVPLLRLGAAGR